MATRDSRSRSARKADQEFVSEAEEILERMREGLALLSEQRAGDREVDPNLVNSVFRAAHSLKGLAGLFGLEGMGGLAHHLEDILDSLRLGRMPLENPAFELLDEAVSLFTVLLKRIGDKSFEVEAEPLIADLVSRIEGAVQTRVEFEDELVGLNLDPSLLRALTEYEEHRLRENIRRGRHLVLVASTFEVISARLPVSPVKVRVMVFVPSAVQAVVGAAKPAVV